MCLLVGLLTTQPRCCAGSTAGHASCAPVELHRSRGLLYGFHAKPRREDGTGLRSAQRGEAGLPRSAAFRALRSQCHRRFRNAHRRAVWIWSRSRTAALRGGKADSGPRDSPAPARRSPNERIRLQNPPLSANRPQRGSSCGVAPYGPRISPSRTRSSAQRSVTPPQYPRADGRISAAPTDPAQRRGGPAGPSGAAAQRVPGAAPEERRTPAARSGGRRASHPPGAESAEPSDEGHPHLPSSPGPAAPRRRPRRPPRGPALPRRAEVQRVPLRGRLPPPRRGAAARAPPPPPSPPLPARTHSRRGRRRPPTPRPPPRPPPPPLSVPWPRRWSRSARPGGGESEAAGRARGPGPASGSHRREEPRGTAAVPSAEPGPAAQDAALGPSSAGRAGGRLLPSKQGAAPVSCERAAARGGAEPGGDGTGRGRSAARRRIPPAGPGRCAEGGGGRGRRERSAAQP